jgi:hypothetical protein
VPKPFARLVLILVALNIAGLLESCQRAREETQPTPPDLPVAEGRRLDPVDEAPLDPSFLKFREDLLRAVDRRDAPFILSILDPSIKNSFGGNDGIAEFRQMWRLEKADSELWGVLQSVLTHGGTFRDDFFTAPYVFSSFPSDLTGDDLEGYHLGAVLEENVPLRSRPDENSPPAVRLSYHIVKTIDEPGLPAGWIKVATTTGTSGYIPMSTFRNVIDYRASFTRQSGAWRMIMLLAGD